MALPYDCMCDNVALLIVKPKAIVAHGEHFVPKCTLLCFLPTTHTHTVIHRLLMDYSLTPPSHPPPPTPHPFHAHSASSASGRVAFILSIILYLTICPVPQLQLLAGRERKRVEQNQLLPSTDLLAAMTHRQAALLFFTWEPHMAYLRSVTIMCQNIAQILFSPSHGTNIYIKKLHENSCAHLKVKLWSKVLKWCGAASI